MKWILPQTVDVPQKFCDAIGGHPLISQMLYRRGIQDEDTALAFLDTRRYRPSPAEELLGVKEAVCLITEAIQNQQRICVWGDFDVDGQTATTILVSGLEKIGADVIYHIPNREKESHGIKLEYLKKMMEQKFDILLTCDTGISESEAINYAKSQGITTIITDHHDLPETLPLADVLIDPKFLDSSHPLSPLSGAAVAYKLVEALFETCQMADESQAYLDLVALSLVADVAPLYGDSRYLTQIGLNELRVTQRQGLLELMALANTQPATLTEENIGFEIAPRLNALGRLSDTREIVEFFTTRQTERARILASRLEGLNNQRKLITEQIYQGALSQIQHNPDLLDYAVLLLSHTAWHPGIIGLVASRLVEQYHKPVILLCTPAGKNAHGSARSIEGVDISAAIRQNDSYLLGYGGHPMAAGMSLPADNIVPFRKALSKTILQMSGTAEIEPTLGIDAFVTIPQIDVEFATELERLAPFGAANPPLTFVCKNVHITGYKFLGRDQKHMLISIEDREGSSQEIIWWRADQEELPQYEFDLAFRMRLSAYRGKNNLSLVWVDARAVEEETPASTVKSSSRIEIIDYRLERQSVALLKHILEKDTPQIFAETPLEAIENAKDRNNLEAGEALLIWTPPPSMQILQEIINITHPERIYLFNIQPDIHDYQAFLMRLAGHVKFALSRLEGHIDLKHLTAVTAQRSSAVRLGLTWMEKRGDIFIESEENGIIRLLPGNRKKQDDIDLYQEEVKSILLETAAFRAYYRKASPENLMQSNPFASG